MTADKIPFYTVDGLAERLAVSPITVRRMVASGDLPAVRVGRVLRFSPADVDAYLSQRRIENRPARK